MKQDRAITIRIPGALVERINALALQQIRSLPQREAAVAAA